MSKHGRTAPSPRPRARLFMPVALLISAPQFVSLGCGQEASAKPVAWSRNPDFYISGDRASDQVERAALGALSAAELTRERLPGDKRGVPLARRTLFLGGQRTQLVQAIQAERIKFRAAISQSQQMPVKFRKLGTAPVSLQGHRLISLTNLWELENACKAGRWGQVVSAYTLIDRHGLYLLSGAGMEASMGCTILGEARKVIARHLAIMPAGSLSELSARLLANMGPRPNLKQIVELEGEVMLSALQQVQNLQLQGENRKIGELLGFGGAELASDLRKYASKPADAISVFNWIGSDIQGQIKYQLAKVAEPTATDSREPLTRRARWMNLHRRLASNFHALMPTIRSTVARSRILIIELALRARQRSQQPLPTDLSKFPTQITTDPFTGGPLIYIVAENKFRVYSAGEDRSDNGGVAGTDGADEDITLEPA